jgi:hypothetical protein
MDSDRWAWACLKMGAGRLRQAGGISGPAGAPAGENVWDRSHDAPLSAILLQQSQL